mgnify:CR=1 FL=1
MVFAGACWCLLVFAGVCWCLLVVIDACFTLLWRNGACGFLIVVVGAHMCIHVFGLPVATILGGIIRDMDGFSRASFDVQ